MTLESRTDSLSLLNEHSLVDSFKWLFNTIKKNSFILIPLFIGSTYLAYYFKEKGILEEAGVSSMFVEMDWAILLDLSLSILVDTAGLMFTLLLILPSLAVLTVYPVAQYVHTNLRYTKVNERIYVFSVLLFFMLISTGLVSLFEILFNNQTISNIVTSSIFEDTLVRKVLKHNLLIQGLGSGYDGFLMSSIVLFFTSVSFRYLLINSSRRIIFTGEQVFFEFNQLVDALTFVMIAFLYGIFIASIFSSVNLYYSGVASENEKFSINEEPCYLVRKYNDKMICKTSLQEDSEVKIYNLQNLESVTITE